MNSTQMDTNSVASSDDSLESLEDILSDFKTQIRALVTFTNGIDAQVKRLYAKAKEETVNWATEPLIPAAHVKAWFEEHGLGETPTIREFLEAVFKAALTMDYETRILTFRKKDAEILWKGQQSLTVFDIIGCIPSLFL